MNRTINSGIKFARLQKGLTQVELSKMLLIELPVLQRWEIGNDLPSIDNLIKLSKILEKNIDFLIFSKSSPPLSFAHLTEGQRRIIIELYSEIVGVRGEN